MVARFLSEHLPVCSCPYPVRRLHHELRAALAQLLEVLRADGIGVQDSASSTTVAHELARFDKHMRDVWGLADSTRRQRERIVGEFLLFHFSDEPITMSKIGANAARRFVLGDPGRSPGTIRVIGGAVGCYLRFRSMSGDRVSQLEAAIPRVAHWRLASLPEVLTDAEIDELLQSFDQPFPSHRRAYAMTRCLIDLGLRSSEVVNLRLEDINWAEGTISLIGSKGRRADVLPLLSAICARSAPRPPIGPYLFGMSPRMTRRLRKASSSVRSWLAIEDADGPARGSTFYGTVWPVDFYAPACR